MKRVFSLLVLLAMLRNLILGQETFTVVAPTGATKEEGNAATRPFCCGGSIDQFLYDEINFIEGMPSGGVITELAFRLDGPHGQQADILIPEIEIYMFTTPTRVKDVNNPRLLPHGLDRALVFPRGALRMSSDWSTNWPNPFNLRIPLSQPFKYCPWAGTLVIEIFQYTDGSGARLDTHGDQSSVLLLEGSGYDNPPVTQFTFTSAEESCLRISIQREGNTVKLSSSDGGIIEKTHNLEAGEWVKTGLAPQLHAITNRTLFFRVRKDGI